MNQLTIVVTCTGLMCLAGKNAVSDANVQSMVTMLLATQTEGL